MELLLGGPGTLSGLLLRLGQCAFGSSSIAIMLTSFGFSRYTAFCYLIASMVLQVLWSFGLACLDIYALRRKRDQQNPILLSLFVNLFVLLDWVTATLSLAAACSSAGIVVLFERDLNFCSIQKNLPCSRYQISVAMAFITWILTAISSHVMFWILASV